MYEYISHAQLLFLFVEGNSEINALLLVKFRVLAFIWLMLIFKAQKHTVIKPKHKASVHCTSYGTSKDSTNNILILTTLPVPKYRVSPLAISPQA
jgi:hypothetical protein